MASKHYTLICHMLTSLDGRVTGDFLESQHGEKASQLYFQTLETFDYPAWICDQVTFEEIFDNPEPLDLSQYPSVTSREDYLVPGFRSYAIAIDTKGKVHWKTNTAGNDYTERANDHIVTVLSRQVDDRYLGFLQQMGISYLFADDEGTISMRLAMEKLAKKLNLDRFVLAGGGHVNGSFFAEDLVDEVSLIISPEIEGHSNQVALAEYGTKDAPIRSFHLHSSQVLEKDYLWIKYRK